MFDAHLRYLAVAFVDAESVRPNQAEITELIGAFSDLELVPMAVHESLPFGQDRRIGFVSADNIWQILLLGKQFQVSRASKDPLGADLGEFPGFCEQANGILKWALNRFERRPHRLAAVQEGLLKQKSEDEIDVIAHQLLTLPKMFKQHPLNEWDWRASARVDRKVGDRNETLNTIATIKKLNFTVSPPGDSNLAAPLAPLPVKVTVIRADIDINTSQENTSARFQDAHMDYFFENVIDWHGELIGEINTLINQGG